MHRSSAPGRLQLKGNNVRTTRNIAMGAAIVLLLGPAPICAQDTRDRTVEQYQCKDVMRDSGVNRDVAIAFLHGFLLGRSGSAQFNLDVLQQQTDAFVELCLNNPNEKAVDAMTTVKK
jgi:hypothetical protein